MSLAFRHDPMFDANGLAAQAIGPARDVAGGEDAWRARFEIGVDDDAAIDPEARRLGELDARAHAHPRDDEIGLEDASARKFHLSTFNARSPCSEMEDDAMLLMQSIE